MYAQTCRRMSTLADADYLWHRLAMNGVLSISPHQDPMEISGMALRREALRSLRLQANWRRATPRLKSCYGVRRETLEGSYDEMDLLPEGKALLAIRRLGRGDRPFFTASVFSLTDVSIAHELARIKVPGTLVHHDISLATHKHTFALAATILLDEQRCVDCSR